MLNQYHISEPNTCKSYINKKLKSNNKKKQILNSFLPKNKNIQLMLEEWVWTAWIHLHLDFLNNAYYSTTPFKVGWIHAYRTLGVEDWLWSYIRIFYCTGISAPSPLNCSRVNHKYNFRKQMGIFFFFFSLLFNNPF